MSDVSKLNFGDNGGDRNVKDAIAREKLTVIDPTEGEGLITFGVDANGNYGYKKVGADTVTPFSNGKSVGGYALECATKLYDETIHLYNSFSNIYSSVIPKGTYYIFFLITNDNGTPYALYDYVNDTKICDITHIANTIIGGRSNISQRNVALHVGYIDLSNDISANTELCIKSNNSTIRSYFTLAKY